MISGIYSGVTALNNYAKQQELISANLAHLNTNGYRRQVASFHERMDVSNGQATSLPGSRINQVATDFGQGVNQVTGRKLDLALSGEAFFVYQGENEKLYSRNGALYRSTDGTLVNGDGLPILDKGKPIKIPDDVSDQDISVTTDGQISANGNAIGQLSRVKFDNPQLLQSDSQVYFKIGNATASPDEETMVIQGSRELSNAHSVTELISLIVGSRNFEAGQRAIRSISDAIQENIRA